MNKKILTTLFAVILQITLYAGNDVPLYNDVKGSSKGHRYEAPVVTDEGSTVTITSEELVSNVRIIIKDVSGTVISDETITLLPSDNVISIPEEYKNDKYLIEIYYGDNCFYGYFD